MTQRKMPDPTPAGGTVQKDTLGRTEPRLPHERDESADSQASPPRKVIKQANTDIESGQEDTDLRGSRGRRETSVPKSSD